MVPPSVIRANLESVRRRVAAAAERSGRAPESVRLVAVTKTVGLDEIRALHDLGVRDFGESRVLEALRRIEALKGLGARWHMIGHIQTRKANKAIGAFDLIHSLDSMRLAQALDAAAARTEVIVSALVEVNVSGEETKSGFAPGELGAALEKISAMKSLRVDGLMAMAPIAADPEQTRPVFAELRALRDRFARAAPGIELRLLSMGMTQDFEVAVEEGADLIRVGTGLFRES
jgi:pyridoxal phosphate enzyme (YggS family)